MDEVETLDLVRLEAVGAAHPRENGHYLLCQRTNGENVWGPGGVYNYWEGGLSSTALMMMSGLHLLANGRILLEEKINVDIKVAGLQAPGHATNNLHTKYNIIKFYLSLVPPG